MHFFKIKADFLGLPLTSLTALLSEFLFDYSINLFYIPSLEEKSIQYLQKKEILPDSKRCNVGHDIKLFRNHHILAMQQIYVSEQSEHEKWNVHLRHAVLLISRQTTRTIS